MWSSSLCVAVFHASRSAALVFFRFLSCSDKYCGQRATLVAAITVLAASLGLTLDSIEKVFNHLKAVRQNLQVGESHQESRRLGAVDAVRRFIDGLRSQDAAAFMAQFENSPPLLPRFAHGEHLIEWVRSKSLDTACLEKYFPGWLISVLFLFLITGGWIVAIAGCQNISVTVGVRGFCSGQELLV